MEGVIAHGVDDIFREALQCHRLDRLDKAVTLYRQVLEIDPTRADAAHLYGLAEIGRGEMARGIQAMILSVRLKPGVAQVEHDLGLALADIGHLDRAIEHVKQALAIDPDFVQARINLADLLIRLAQPNAAVEELERARTVAPEDPLILFRLGRALSAVDDWAGAAAAYESCLALDAEHADARYYLADLELTAGQFDAGWDNYEARWHRPKLATEPRPFTFPVWRGEALEGRTILAWGEQGVGEEILFASMIPDLQALGGDVLVECDPRLQPLFNRSFAGIETVGRTYPPSSRIGRGDIDLQTATGSLGRWLRLRSSDFQPQPYLSANDEAIEGAERRYRSFGSDPKIGISWRSVSPLKNFASYKSSPIAAWKAVLDRPEVDFINLQYGECADDLEFVEREWGRHVHIDPDVDQLVSLDDFAAQIGALDLVITTSNTTAHVAGALGKTVWVVLPVKSGWRWGRERSDSLWYANARLFRQQAREDWTMVLNRVARALDDWQSRRGRNG